MNKVKTGCRSVLTARDLLPTGISSGVAAFFFPEVDHAVGHEGDKVADHETGEQSVCESDEAPDKGHLIADEELAEEGEMRTDDVAAIENQPIRSNENS